MKSFGVPLAFFSAIGVAAVACSSAPHATSTGGNGASQGSGGAPSTGAGHPTTSNASGMSNVSSSGSGGSTGALAGVTVGSGSSGSMCPAFKSCAELGFDCGMASDGCGNLQDCGTCSGGASCGGGGKPNVCGSPACNAKTCAQLNFNCGMAGDTCGGTIDCGTCGTGQTCGAQSPDVCGAGGTCMPKNCVQLGYDCGMQGDGCGHVMDCGSCALPQVCGGGANPTSGVCGTPPTCVPKTCAQQGFNCGMATDGCGNVLDCSMGAMCPTGQVCGGGGPNVCGGNGDCPAGSELVYVWDTDGVIHSFDPPTKTFTTIATPDCSDASMPNSMAIDRNLVAWLNYLNPASDSPNDYIYKFDLKTKTGCTASGINIPTGYNQVGMGFSTDTPGGNTETLFVDGIGNSIFGGSGAGLAKVDMTNNTIVPIGTFSNDPNLSGQSCELTGTGDARLFGYFTTSPYVRVAQLDKTTSNAISDNQLQGFAPPMDWAFSFWGGDFYLYAYPNASNSATSSVIHYIPSTGTVDESYIANVGFTIIGAGVSTCAPTTPCLPKTCAQDAVTCGVAGDGCGNIIMCGSCPSGQACVAGSCTNGCTPKSCGAQGFSCGMQGDGCGNAISCGSCPSGQGCNAGSCSMGGCTPTTCMAKGYVCGSVGDGCGNIINCGTCPAGEICGGMTPGQCYKPPCTPKTCTGLGYNCGQATDGCGNVINCGSCTGSQTCGGGGMANVCGGAG